MKTLKVASVKIWAVLLATGVLAGCARAPVVKPATAATVAARAPAKAAERPAAELFADAQTELKARDLDGAKADLTQYVAQRPTDPVALFQLGWVLEQQGQTAAAKATYRRALAARTKGNAAGQSAAAGQEAAAATGAALNLARLEDRAGQTADGVFVLRGRLAEQDGDARLGVALAELLRRENKLDDAEGAVRKVLARHSRNADALRVVALIEADRGRPGVAEWALTQVREIDPTDPGVPNNLGVLALRRGDASAARARFEEAVKLDANFALGWANLGAVALSYRDYAAAADAYLKATQLGGASWNTHLAYGWALEGAKKPREARAEYEMTLQAKPGQEDALFGRAVALKAEGDLPGAMAAFQLVAASSNPQRSKEAQGQIAAIDLRLKNPPQAARPAPDAAKAEAKHESNAGSDLSSLPIPTGAEAGGDLKEPALPSADPELPPIPLPGAPGQGPTQPASPPQGAPSAPGKSGGKPAPAAAPSKDAGTAKFVGTAVQASAAR